MWVAVSGTRWISGYTERFTHVESDVVLLKQNMIVVNKRLDGIDGKLKTMAIRNKKKFKAIDAKFEVLDKRITSLEVKVDWLEDKMEAKFDALDKKFDSKFDALLMQLSFNNQIRPSYFLLSCRTNQNFSIFVLQPGNK